jgi:hypothetical protein
VIARYLFQGLPEMALNVFGTFPSTEKNIELVTDNVTIGIAYILYSCT